MNVTSSTAIDENVLIEASADLPSSSNALPDWVVDDGLAPPTYANVAYWRQLCGVLSLAKGCGVADGEWPDELAPTRPTLTALTERGIIVRRKRAWHLKRDWYTRLSSLRQRAVPTPRITFSDRPRADLPSYAELKGFERICRWLDAQPKRRARLPFVGLKEQLNAESEVPVALLTLMRKHRLVRHANSCEWVLSPTWRDRLAGLWKGVDRELRERFVTQPSPADPFVVAAGIDTWYLNRLDPAGLPLSLRHELDDLQVKATEDEEEIDTRWHFDGVPLQMYRAGVSAKQGGGVSWSYILRNPSLALLIRRSPLGGIIAQARLGSECLWRLTPRRALDEVDALVRRMWARPLPFRRAAPKSDVARWQVSQVHLAVDVANAPLELEQLSRFVSRSRTQAVYEAAQAEVEQLLRVVDSDDASAAPLVMDWDALYSEDDFSMGAFGVGADRAEEPEPVGDRASTVYRYGKRLSGVTFSPGGDVSMVLYDKVLQGRLSGKRHMEPIWAASGWHAGTAVTRHEARLRRTAIRELGLPGDMTSTLDDPWEFLQHMKDVFGAVVGRSEACPDAVDVAWIRRVIPDEQDSNRSRWPTDAAWQAVQGASFADAPAEARRLIRRRQRGADVAVLDRGLYGYLVSRVALKHPNGGEWTISRALGETRQALDALELHKGKDFGELVRERRRQRGLPVPMVERMLPVRSVVALSESTESPESGELSDAAESRMAEAWVRLAEAESRGVSERAITQLETAYLHEAQAYSVHHDPD